jgi:hypothetical protein
LIHTLSAAESKESSVTGPHPDSDIVPLLTHDHDVLRHLTTGFSGLGPHERDMRLRDLTIQLVRHEFAEERVVHSAIRVDVLPGDAVTSILLAQETDIKELLATLKRLDSAGTAFDAVLDGLQTQVLEHFRDEEVRLFPLVLKLESDVRRWELGDKYASVIRTAPTSPHPHVPSSRPQILVAEPIAALIDRVRDSVQKATE